MTRLLTDDAARSAYATRGRCVFLQRYTLDGIAARMKDLLYSVAQMRAATATNLS
jgi:hypothetical protein